MQTRAIGDARPPPILFKFRAFPSIAGLTGGRLEMAEWQRDQVFQIFRGRLRLAKPDSFNDPFEFKPAVKFPPGPPDQVLRRAKKYVTAAVKERLPWKERIKLLHNPEKLNRTAAKLDELTAASVRRMRDEIEIYCLTANEKRPLLWSHYADGHRGIAIHFDGTKPPFVLSWKVNYSINYPQVTAGGDRSTEENWRRIQQSLLVKDKDWAYEDEFRFLAPQSRQSVEMLRDQGVVQQADILTADPSIVRGVTIGAKMPADAEADLRAFLVAERPDVYVRRAKLSDARFEIEIVDG